MRSSIIAVLFLVACGEPEVVDDPRDTTSFVERCDRSTPCSAGKVCNDSGYCVSLPPPNDTSDSGEDTEPPGDPDAADPSDSESEDIETPIDVDEPVDIDEPDDVEEPLDVEDAVDTGPPPADECPLAGESCTDILETCRVSNEHGGLVCSGSTGFKPLGAPCTQHLDCDLNLGCHEGICTAYCEVQFGCAKIPGQACTPIGHPTWGACTPPPGG